MSAKQFLSSIIIITLIAAFLVHCTPVKADEYIYVGGWSYHTKSHPKDGFGEYTAPSSHKCHKYGACVSGTREKKYEFNSDHDMIGYQAKGFMVAHYTNSFDQSTWLVAKHFESHLEHNLSVIAQIGVTNGYTDCDFEDSGTKAKTCGYYQVGMAYNKFKVQPVLSTTGSVWMLSFRVKI